MSAIASKSLESRSSLLRTVVLGGTFVFLVQAIHMSIIVGLIQKSQVMGAWQYIASGALGVSAFAGGIATALVGVFFHLVFSFVIAAVFILAVDRIPLLRRYIIPLSLLYGLGVFIVMNMIVIPLSAAPPLPTPTTPWLIEAALQHVLFVGLSLGLLVRMSDKADV